MKGNAIVYYTECCCWRNPFHVSLRSPKKKLHDGTALFRGRRRRRHTPTRRSGWDGFDGSFPNTRLGFGFFLGFRLTRRRYRLVITGEASVLALGVLLILKGPFACLVVIVKGEVAFDGHLFAIRREGIW